MLAALSSKTLRADEAYKLTVFTFDAPIELPGVTLPAGTYTFELMDSGADRNVVQVFNKNMTKLYATVLAIPDYRVEPSDRTIIRFSERTPVEQEAIKEWFYPGDNFGQEFVYPQSRAKELAIVTDKPVPSMPDELKPDITKPVKSAAEPSVKAMKNAQLEAEQPSGGEVPIPQAFETKPNQQSNENTRHQVNSEATDH